MSISQAQEMKTAKTVPVHRRRGRPEEDEQVELLDQDDQEKLVQKLQAESAKQQEQIETLFGGLCRVVALIALLSALLVQRRASVEVSGAVLQLRWAHAALAALLHWNTPVLMARNDGSGSIPLSWRIYKPAAASVLVAAVALFLARRADDSDSLHLHYGLILSNGAIAATAAYLRRERNLSEKSVDDLRASKYRYKSL